MEILRAQQTQCCCFLSWIVYGISLFSPIYFRGFFFFHLTFEHVYHPCIFFGFPVAKLAFYYRSWLRFTSFTLTLHLIFQVNVRTRNKAQIWKERDANARRTSDRYARNEMMQANCVYVFWLFSEKKTNYIILVFRMLWTIYWKPENILDGFAK